MSEDTYSGFDRKLSSLLDFLFKLMNIVSFFVVIIIIFFLIFQTGITLRDLYDSYNISSDELNQISHIDFVDKALTILELLFIIPVPILISSSIYLYYKKTIKNTYSKIASIDQRTLILNTIKSSIEISMSKYNFFTIIISTGFIILIKAVNNTENVDESRLFLFAILIVGVIGLMVYTYFLKHSILKGSMELYTKFTDLPKIEEFENWELNKKNLEESKDEIEKCLDKKLLDISEKNAKVELLNKEINEKQSRLSEIENTINKLS